MNVFVLEGHWNWEGFEIVGIFSSKEKAESMLASFPRNGTRITDSVSGRSYDDCEITEHEVQE